MYRPAVAQDPCRRAAARELLREAGDRAGLDLARLAERAGVSLDVVARIERGETSPTVETWSRLLEAAGFEPYVRLRPRTPPDSHMLDDVERILSLTPEQRLLEVRNLNRLDAALRRA